MDGIKLCIIKKSGYVSGEYVKLLTEQEIAETTVVEYFHSTYALVNINTSLNIRDRANKEGKILTSVKASSILKVYEKMQNNWYKVEGNTIYGYVSGDYIKMNIRNILHQLIIF